LFILLGHPASASEVAERWPRWAQQGNFALVAARPDDTIAAVAALHQTENLHKPTVGRIALLIVDAAERGQGLGRRLVAAAESELARAGCGTLEITSNFRHGAAHSFYENIGYRRTSYRFEKVLLQSV
jgi:GNAT superfamily N-acetyltransferase